MEQKNEELKERLYDKSYTCPICNKNFKAKQIKKGKTIFVEMDLGLRGKFKPIMPDYYYVIMCDNCGYTAVAKTFDKTNGKHIKAIQKNINKNYHPKNYPEVYTADIAIDRYKIALYFAHIKQSDISEKAYIAQKIAFIYGDINNKEGELEYNTHAYNWYSEAYIEEKFPIMDMEENQFLYNLAYLAYKIGNKDEAKKTLGKLIIKKDISNVLKEKIEEFRDILRNDEES